MSVSDALTFGSVCSGIGGAEVAWSRLGWRSRWCAEIDPFASAVLAARFPRTPNLGDFTKIRKGVDADAVDVLGGGTPCQSFSVAGLRKGLDDARGDLTLEFLGLVGRLLPRWVVWENVPGVLSIDGGRTFGAVLGLLGELGYGFAYRVLDAQYFGLAQRRRRVFVVAYRGDWRPPAAVLFERESLSGNPPPRREAGQATAPTLAARTRGGGGLGTDFDCDGGLIHFQGRGTNLEFGGDVAGTLGTTIDRASGAAPCIAHTLNAKGGAGRMDFETETLVAHALRADGFDASEDGTGRGTPLVPICFTSKDYGNDAAENVAPTLRSMNFDKSHANAGGQLAVCFDETKITSATNRCQPQPGDPSHPLPAGARAPTIAFHARQDPDSGPVTHPLDTDGSSIGIFANWRVRRLTPVECERLQGFPDGYTGVPYRGKPAADGPRYKALGNSMAVNVMRWIGARISEVDRLEPTA